MYSRFRTRRDGARIGHSENRVAARTRAPGFRSAFPSRVEECTRWCVDRATARSIAMFTFLARVRGCAPAARGAATGGRGRTPIGGARLTLNAAGAFGPGARARRALEASARGDG